MKKYEQIISDIIGAAQNGSLKKGDRLSSIRELSKKYGCSKDTVLKALMELKYQNIVYPVEKSGYYLLKGKEYNNSKKKSYIDFADSMPDQNLFPYEDFRLCFNQAIMKKEGNLFTYYLNHKGLSELIDSLYSLLCDYQIYTKKENIVVTSGIQQALYILSQINFPNNKETILIEQPTYHMMNKIVKEQGLNYEKIQRTADGVNIDELEYLFRTKDIKFFYTIPRFQNPLGVCYTNHQKKQLVELAEKYDVYIVEDDYLADFDKNYTNDPLYFFDSSDHVIYLKSFSKIIFPALRIGCVVLPNKLVEPFVNKKNLIDYDSNLIAQKALSLYIESGMFQKHKVRLSNLYHKKAVCLYQALELLGLNSIVNEKTLDTKTTFKLKPDIKIDKLKQFLKAQNIHVDFLENNYIDNTPYLYIKIDVRNMEQKEIQSGVYKLYSILDKEMII